MSYCRVERVFGRKTKSAKRVAHRQLCAYGGPAVIAANTSSFTAHPSRRDRVDPHFHLLLSPIPPHAVRNGFASCRRTIRRTDRPVKGILPGVDTPNSAFALNDDHAAKQASLEMFGQPATRRRNGEPVEVGLVIWLLKTIDQRSAPQRDLTARLQNLGVGFELQRFQGNREFQPIAPRPSGVDMSVAFGNRGAQLRSIEPERGGLGPAGNPYMQRELLRPVNLYLQPDVAVPRIICFLQDLDRRAVLPRDAHLPADVKVHPEAVRRLAVDVPTNRGKEPGRRGRAAGDFEPGLPLEFCVAGERRRVAERVSLE